MEGLVAYSSEYGRIGVYDIVKESSGGRLFKHYHRNQGDPPMIAWAKIKDSPTDMLLTCGGYGELFAFNPQRLDEPPLDIAAEIETLNPDWMSTLQIKLKTRRCCMGVDPQGVFLALGHTDGLVEVYKLDTLKLFYTADCFANRVTSLAWSRKYQGT